MNFILVNKTSTHILRTFTQIGTSQRANILLSRGSTSSPYFHATIQIKQNVVILTDYSNGKTFVNDFEIDQTYLFHGDTIQFNEEIYTFKIAKTIIIDLSSETNPANHIETIDLTDDNTQFMEISSTSTFTNNDFFNFCWNSFQNTYPSRAAECLDNQT